jgi:hypothetical protein
MTDNPLKLVFMPPGRLAVSIPPGSMCDTRTSAWSALPNIGTSRLRSRWPFTPNCKQPTSLSLKEGDIIRPLSEGSAPEGTT